MSVQNDDITELLEQWRGGDEIALNRLLTLVRQELRVMARRHLADERSDCSMQPSSLLHEAVIRLLPTRPTDWQSRAHFFRVMSQIMRHVLVDHARRKQRQKRGGDMRRAPLEDRVALTPSQLEEVVTIDVALQRLHQLDERKGQVFEMRFFGGCSVEETAAALGVSENTVIRDWTFARAWLRRQLEPSP